MSMQVTYSPAMPSPKVAFLTETHWDRNRNKNRHLNPDYLGAEDVNFVNAGSEYYDFYDADALKNEIYETPDEDDDDRTIDDLILLLSRRTIEEICIYCLVTVDKVTGEEIGNVLNTSREMARVRAHQIAEKIRIDKEHADDRLFKIDDETIETIKNIIYSSSDEKLAYLYALNTNKAKSSRGRDKAALKATKNAAQASLFEFVEV